MSEALIVNLGSSRVAWRGPGGSGAGVHGGRPGALLAARLEAPLSRRVIVGSVAAAGVNEELHGTLGREWGIESRWLEATAEACGVRNGYDDPARLGVDRWAAMVAAFHDGGGPLTVVDCGTALTLDHVDAGGRHLGGLIAPGLGAMRAALGTTTRLPRETLGEPAPELPELGRDTAKAVAAGCMAAVAGLIERTQARIADSRGGACRLWITGGDADAVMTRLAAHWRHAPGLVIDGLALLAGETA